MARLDQAWSSLLANWSKAVRFLSGKQSGSLSEQAVVLFAGNILALSFGIAVPIVLVRVFPREAYGLYQQLLLIFTTLQPFGQWGVTQGLYYFLPREPENRAIFVAQTYLFVLVVGCLCCAGLFMFQHSIAGFMNNPAIADYIPVLAIYTLLMTISAFLEALLIAEGKAHGAAILRIGSEFFRATSLVATALVTRSIYAMFFSLTLLALARCVFQWYYLRKNYQLSLKNVQFFNLKRQISYSFPIGFANVIFLMQQKLHNFVVTFLFSPVTYALYSIGSYNLPFLGIITSSVSNIMVPELSRCQKEGNNERMLTIWQGALRKSNLLLFPSFAFFFVLADTFIVFFFTEQYQASIPIFRVSLFGILLSGANAGAILNAFAATKYQMKLALFRLPVTLLLVYTCTITYGIHGAIAANVVAFSFFRFLMIAKAARVMRLPLKDLICLSMNGKIMAAALSAGLAVGTIQYLLQLTLFWTLATSVPIFLVIYCLLALGLGVLSRKEIILCCKSVLPGRTVLRKTP